MNKFVYGAIALTTVSASAFATDNGWVSLDQEINNLNASLSAQNATGPKVGGYIQARYDNSGDLLVEDPVSGDDHDLSGFTMSNVRVEITGDAGSDYSYKVSFDLADTSANDGAGNGDASDLLKDAYVKFKISDQVTGKFGQFKANFLRSSTTSDNKLVLLDRTWIGDGHEWNDRDIGLEIGFNYDTINVTVSGQNGQDLQGDDYELCAKATINLMGGGVGKVEGAYGAGDSTALSFGVAYLEDMALDSGTTIGVELYMTSGPFSLGGEMVDLDTDNFIDVGPLSTSDSTPWAATGSYLFSDMWEGVVRYQDLDDADNSSGMTFGLNYFVSGHDIKWVAQYDSLATDNAIDDVSIISVGISVSM